MLLTLMVAACGGANDAANDADASAPDATPSLDASPDAPAIPAFPCGPTLTTTWTRCDGNAIVRPGRRFADGNLELSVGDPSVLYDADERLWKAWWSSGAAR
jgi:hypothetical protein